MTDIENNPIPVEVASQRDSHTNWTSTIAGKLIAGSVLAAEITPLNEAMRLAAFGMALKYGDPVSATIIAGSATMLIEGAAAVTTADVLDTDAARKIVTPINDKLEKVAKGKMPKTGIVSETALALVGGSAVVTVAKHVQDPTRSRSVNRRYGLRYATGITAYTVAGAYPAAEALQHVPATIKLGALAAGAVIGGAKFSRNRLADKTEVVHKPVNKGESPQRLGLSAEDAADVLGDPRTVSIREEGKDIPVLVPIDRLYWYNHEYLKQRFNTEDIFYYAHPDIQGADSVESVRSRVAEIVDKHGVVLYDTVTAGNTVYGDLDHELQQAGMGYQKVPIRKDGRQRFLYQYDGEFKIRGGRSSEYRREASLYETYEKAIADGKLTEDPENGPALKNSISGEEAERLWSIYHRPFEKLSHEHPVNSGYDKEGFMDILQDPAAVKAVYRQGGEITTLALFVNSLDHCTWLDANYYSAKYPEATATENHFIFPGIVTDELKRGASYSVPLMQLIAKVQSLRKTPAIISFECTDISYKYIPRIVRFAIAKSGVAKTTGFKKPVSRFDYYAITK